MKLTMCGVIGRAGLCSVLVTGCVDEQRSDGGLSASGGAGTFGGSVLDDAGADAGGSAGQGGAPSDGGRCGSVLPGSEPRIDNFEDGDTYPVPEPGRNGSWTTRDDGSGGIISLSVDQGGADGTDFAAHIAADGFAQNASFDLNIAFSLEGVNCPYNAGNFAGVSFFSKGEGRIELKAQTTDVFSTEFAGTCDDTTEICWDSHRKLVPLSPEWTYHEIRWDDLTQAGWGKYVILNPEHLIGLSLNIAAASMPMDLWIDEVRFLEATGGEASGP